MNKIIIEGTNEIKKAINTISKLSLEIDVSNTINEQVYSEEDLANVSLIFIHIVGNLTAANLLKKEGPIKGLEIAGKEFNKLKDVIFNLTGIDTHLIFNK